LDQEHYLNGYKGIIWRKAGGFKGNRWPRQVYYNLLENIDRQSNKRSMTHLN
jgi:hypothetical protein